VGTENLRAGVLHPDKACQKVQGILDQNLVFLRGGRVQLPSAAFRLWFRPLCLCVAAPGAARILLWPAAGWKVLTSMKKSSWIFCL